MDNHNKNHEKRITELEDEVVRLRNLLEVVIKKTGLKFDELIENINQLKDRDAT